MIEYSARRPMDYVRWSGSVAPKCLAWAVPCAAIAALYHYALHNVVMLEALTAHPPTQSETTGWTLFTSILGFLLVFRAQLSYSRYWEGLTLVEQGCGVWLNGCSNLIAFCSTDPELQDKVDEFQYLLSRLMSLLVSFSMQDISTLERSNFPHLDIECIDPTSIEYLEETSAKQNVVLQWVQRLVVENSRNHVLDIAPPILSRVFQEFSIGIVHFIDATKISSTPFPFAFAQMVWLMLCFFSVLTVPMICAVGMDSYKASIYTFFIVFVFWSLHYIAVEIEMPFGEDLNDLPMEAINRRFNKVLERLLDTKAQQTPTLQSKLPTAVRYMKRDSTIAFHVQKARTEPQTNHAKRRSLLEMLVESLPSGLSKELCASRTPHVAPDPEGARFSQQSSVTSRMTFETTECEGDRVPEDLHSMPMGCLGSVDASGKDVGLYASPGLPGGPPRERGAVHGMTRQPSPPSACDMSRQQSAPGRAMVREPSASAVSTPSGRAALRARGAQAPLQGACPPQRERPAPNGPSEPPRDGAGEFLPLAYSAERI